jgi:hypothetical protein
VIQTWAITNLVMQQLIRQIDPEQIGIVAIIAQCVPPSEEGRKVRSVRERFLEKSPAFKDVENRAYFWGAESLVGSVVATCQPKVVQDIERYADLLVSHRMGEVCSAAAYPLQKSGRVAGCLLILSRQKDYFAPARQALIQSYSYLLSLAFHEHEFYPLEDIELQIMPSEAVQDLFLSTFNQQVNDLLSRAERNGQSLSRPQAEQRIVEAFIETCQKQEVPHVRKDVYDARIPETPEEFIR